MNKIRINSIIICLSELHPARPIKYGELRYWGGGNYYERAWGSDQWIDITSRGVCDHYKGYYI